VSHTAQSFTGETPVPRWLRGYQGCAIRYQSGVRGVCVFLV